ncbi:hypothetical protein A3A93_01235 [Candidatus Roizmanbacteria bacterium RIFCSPLOWO2_01_FULL_38_12]|uniref:Uncharacterized protein n=1 Tax=Candidatus Roizmanbacteria bacterium RIFCSPLOWO2_01_FULL_38_12 TaxID=1802061 RepID=A0A1F7IR64_9BACT|nr:MAG: hypothetical protein A3F59_03050 [Candidatus Roizmanbacteria bacterium RIFCSPHIGHO2_12_FULL_38_13]OGK45822.1 MAG: hypothetical protein A3A93_01235 [Candidatus Roizmanbacteria bacterium RIFCSPLOWO2_01_FULL_38_12]
MKSIPRQYLIVAGVIVVLLVIIGFFTFGRKASETAEDKETVFGEPVEVIPTVDSSVKAQVKGDKDAVITISAVPSGTKKIEYELSYNTTSGSIEGVFGSIDVNGKSTVTEDITFGTCSSGVCRYHSIEGPVKGTFKFSGSYGKRLLEKEFKV